MIGENKINIYASNTYSLQSLLIAGLVLSYFSIQTQTLIKIRYIGIPVNHREQHLALDPTRLTNFCQRADLMVGENKINIYASNTYSCQSLFTVGFVLPYCSIQTKNFNKKSVYWQPTGRGSRVHPPTKPHHFLIIYHFYNKPRTAEKNTFTIYTNILRFFFGSLIVLGLLLYNLTTYWNSLKKFGNQYSPQ